MNWKMRATNSLFVILLPAIAAYLVTDNPKWMWAGFFGGWAVLLLCDQALDRLEKILVVAPRGETARPAEWVHFDTDDGRSVIIPKGRITAISYCTPGSTCIDSGGRAYIVRYSLLETAVKLGIDVPYRTEFTKRDQEEAAVKQWP